MLRLTGNEKAFLGGLVAFLATTIVQLQQTGQFTLRDFCFSLGAWILTHASVWLATNTTKVA